MALPKSICRHMTSAFAQTRQQPLIRPVSRLLALRLTGSRSRVPTSFPELCLPRQAHRFYSQQASPVPEPPEYLNAAELHIFNKIKRELEPVKLEVQDISGGCGSMYAIEIESPRFKGLTVVKQHKLVNQVLKEEIAQWHGVQLRTRVA